MHRFKDNLQVNILPYYRIQLFQDDPQVNILPYYLYAAVSRKSTS